MLYHLRDNTGSNLLWNGCLHQSEFRMIFFSRLCGIVQYHHSASFSLLTSVFIFYSVLPLSIYAVLYVDLCSSGKMQYSSFVFCKSMCLCVHWDCVWFSCNCRASYHIVLYGTVSYGIVSLYDIMFYRGGGDHTQAHHPTPPAWSSVKAHLAIMEC